MVDNSVMIEFHDHNDDQDGFIIVRRSQGKVALCISLEDNGDIEVLIENSVVAKLVEALKPTNN